MRQSKTRKNFFKPRYNLFLKTKSNLWANRFKVRKLIKKRKWGSIFFNLKNSRRIKSTQFRNLRKISNTLLKQNAFLIFNTKKNLLFNINTTQRFKFFKNKNFFLNNNWVKQLFNQLVQNFPILLKLKTQNDTSNILFNKMLKKNLNNFLLNLDNFNSFKNFEASIKNINYFFNFFQNSINFFKIKNDFLKFHNFKKFFVLKRTHQLKFFGNYRDYIENETNNSLFFNKPFFRNNKSTEDLNFTKNSNIFIKHRAIKLIRLKVIKNFYSINSNKKLKKMLKQSIIKGKRYALQSFFSQKLLLKLDTLCYEMNWSRSVLDSKNLLKRKEIFVNNKLQTSKRFFLKPGDLFKIQKPSKTKFFHQMFKKKQRFQKKNFYKKNNPLVKTPSITLWFKFLRRLKNQTRRTAFPVSNDNMFKKINKNLINKIEKNWPFLFLNKSTEQIIFNRMFFNANLKLGRHLKKQLFYPYRLLQKRTHENLVSTHGFSQVKNQYYKTIRTPLGPFFNKRALFTYKTKLYNSKINVLNRKYLSFIKTQPNLNKIFKNNKFKNISKLNPRKVNTSLKMLYGFRSKRALPKSHMRYLTILLPLKTSYRQLNFLKSIFSRFDHKIEFQKKIITESHNDIIQNLKLSKSIINYNNKQIFWLYYKNLKQIKQNNNYFPLSLTNKYFIQNFNKFELSFLSNNFSNYYLYNVNNNANLIKFLKKKTQNKFINNKTWLTNIEKIMLEDQLLIQKRKNFNEKIEARKLANDFISYYDRILESIGKPLETESSYLSLEERRKIEKKNLFETQQLSSFYQSLKKQSKFNILKSFLFKIDQRYLNNLIENLKIKNKKILNQKNKWLNKRQLHYKRQKKNLIKKFNGSKLQLHYEPSNFNLNDLKLIKNSFGKKLIFHGINRKLFNFKDKFINNISSNLFKKFNIKTNWFKFLNLSYTLFFENDIQTNFLYLLKNNKTQGVFPFLDAYLNNNLLSYKDYFFKFEKLYLSLKQSPFYLERRKTKGIVICLPEPSKDFIRRQSLYLDQNNLFRLFK